MIKTKNELVEVLAYERECYYNYMYPRLTRRLLGWLKHEPMMQIWKWQKAERLSNYYDYHSHHFGSILSKILFVYWARVANKKAKSLGIEISLENAGKGFFLYHYGATVINGGCIIGENCHFHGNNCVGNAGPQDLSCPVIGNNVLVGVGAKIIGGVVIADNVKIAAGAIVVKDVIEEGCTVAGVRASIIKRR